MKDEILNSLAKRANVAQFVSFDSTVPLNLRFANIREVESTSLRDPRQAIAALFAKSPEGTVNIRSFRIDEEKGCPFHYGVSSIEDAFQTCMELASSGYFTLLNETIDVRDGGVSGVAFGDTTEFAPEDTPRCVEKTGTCALDRTKATQLLETIYGFKVGLNFSSDERVEFSVHPIRRGFRNEHTIIWEVERTEYAPSSVEPQWPNRFSRVIGDKVFGLLIASVFDLCVPRTTVINRTIAPFTFGLPTGTNEFWMRTCPTQQIPGKLSTTYGWSDPYRVVANEDSGDVNRGFEIASIISQEHIDARYSGGAFIDRDEKCVIEGIEGNGVDFMLGTVAPATLPDRITSDVRNFLTNAFQSLGPVRMEWVHDGENVWIVQLHNMTGTSSGNVIYPGEPKAFRNFETRRGLNELRSLIDVVKESGEGIVLIGGVGITSHFGDLLRKAQIPSRLK